MELAAVLKLLNYKVIGYGEGFIEISEESARLLKKLDNVVEISATSKKGRAVWYILYNPQKSSEILDVLLTEYELLRALYRLNIVVESKGQRCLAMREEDAVFLNECLCDLVIIKGGIDGWSLKYEREDLLKIIEKLSSAKNILKRRKNKAIAISCLASMVLLMLFFKFFMKFTIVVVVQDTLVLGVVLICIGVLLNERIQAQIVNKNIVGVLNINKELYNQYNVKKIILHKVVLSVFTPDGAKKDTEKIYIVFDDCVSEKTMNFLLHNLKFDRAQTAVISESLFKDNTEVKKSKKVDSIVVYDGALNFEY